MSGESDTGSFGVKRGVKRSASSPSTEREKRQRLQQARIDPWAERKVLMGALLPARAFPNEVLSLVLDLMGGILAEIQEEEGQPRLVLRGYGHRMWQICSIRLIEGLHFLADEKHKVAEFLRRPKVIFAHPERGDVFCLLPGIRFLRWDFAHSVEHTMPHSTSVGWPEPMFGASFIPKTRVLYVGVAGAALEISVNYNSSRVVRAYGETQSAIPLPIPGKRVPLALIRDDTHGAVASFEAHGPELWRLPPGATRARSQPVHWESEQRILTQLRVAEQREGLSAEVHVQWIQLEFSFSNAGVLCDVECRRLFEYEAFVAPGEGFRCFVGLSCGKQPHLSALLLCFDESLLILELTTDVAGLCSVKRSKVDSLEPGYFVDRVSELEEELLLLVYKRRERRGNMEDDGKPARVSFLAKLMRGQQENQSQLVILHRHCDNFRGTTSNTVLLQSDE
jgi:hypothetical protein